MAVHLGGIVPGPTVRHRPGRRRGAPGHRRGPPPPLGISAARTAVPGHVSSRPAGPDGLRALGHWRLSTDHGALDIDFEPPATAGHLDLFENARRLKLAVGLEVEVASLADLVRIAEMRRQPHDEEMLPALYEALKAASPAAV